MVCMHGHTLRPPSCWRVSISLSSWHTLHIQCTQRAECRFTKNIQTQHIQVRRLEFELPQKKSRFFFHPFLCECHINRVFQRIALQNWNNLIVNIDSIAFWRVWSLWMLGALSFINDANDVCLSLCLPSLCISCWSFQALHENTILPATDTLNEEHVHTQTYLRRHPWRDIVVVYLIAPRQPRLSRRRRQRRGWCRFCQSSRVRK